MFLFHCRVDCKYRRDNQNTFTSTTDGSSSPWICSTCCTCLTSSTESISTSHSDSVTSATSDSTTNCTEHRRENCYSSSTVTDSASLCAGFISIRHLTRPSASCSGTESETESSRQKHSTASSISFTRIAPPSLKYDASWEWSCSSLPLSLSRPTISAEISLNLTSVLPLADAPLTCPSKLEVLTSETTDCTSSISETNPSQFPTRQNTKISHDYLRQHINYRAQRMASKVEADKVRWLFERRGCYLSSRPSENVALQPWAKSTRPMRTKTGRWTHRNWPSLISFITIPLIIRWSEWRTHRAFLHALLAGRMKAKVPGTVQDAATDPVRKQSVSSHDGLNAPLAPQLKLDANGRMIIDEERSVEYTLLPSVIPRPACLCSLYIRNNDDEPRNTKIVEGRFNDDNLTHQSYRKIGRRKRWNTQGLPSTRSSVDSARLSCL